MQSKAETLLILQEIKRQLEHRKEEIYEEISEYPPPIPACDAQFNYLLELRNGVNQELSQLNVLISEQTALVNPFEQIETFVQSSMVLKNKTKKEIQRLTLHNGEDS